MRVFNITIAGFGGVGRATAKLLLSRRERYRKVYGADVRLVAVCGSRSGLSDPGGLEAERLDTPAAGLSAPDFVAASGADILIEAGPSDFRTGRPGLAYIRSALAAALPTIDLVDYSLKGCELLEIEGILNATTNFLLDAMTTKGLGFDAALQEAQKGGFAEADPRNDTEGWDTACKLLILANFGLGADLTMDELAVEGLQSVTGDRIEAWRAEGVVPKLVGSLTCIDGKFRAAVGIRTYPLSDPLANVRGKDKAIRITTDAMGDTIAIGSGKEPLATAAAALKDLEYILSARVAVPVSISEPSS
jgi:homoserine dehydrogenase